MSEIPDRGDLIWLYCEFKDSEQEGYSPAIVISPKIYNEKSNLITICPITSNKKDWPWKVTLPKHSPVNGAILTDQVKSIDQKARKIRIIGPAPKATLDEALTKVRLLV